MTGVVVTGVVVTGVVVTGVVVTSVVSLSFVSGGLGGEEGEEGVAEESNDPSYRVNKWLSRQYYSHQILFLASVGTRITSVALRYKLRAVRMSGHVNKGQDIGDMGGRGGTVCSSGVDRSCTSTSVGH
ncbi:hypothetical protein Pmani_016947 [Petrolisthes manimaculis]|uniref:Uncharacterized protein n=1 Tax=Petrolisthes manimaculis TaxID=1843537 RepID=A0AAE1U5W8_9EUCA|nr:hypothetical protein Pmani_016947 [Petrolisthes manimaculis]